MASCAAKSLTRLSRALSTKASLSPHRSHSSSKLRLMASLAMFSTATSFFRRTSRSTVSCLQLDKDARQFPRSSTVVARHRCSSFRSASSPASRLGRDLLCAAWIHLSEGHLDIHFSATFAACLSDRSTLSLFLPPRMSPTDRRASRASTNPSRTDGKASRDVLSRRLCFVSASSPSFMSVERSSLCTSKLSDHCPSPYEFEAFTLSSYAQFSSVCRDTYRHTFISQLDDPASASMSAVSSHSTPHPRCSRARWLSANCTRFSSSRRSNSALAPTS
mmetsp:Transcript_61570/g.84657  ORF Transcript_61570/g.84657 Transcript_61570/m.84657 type:complete len:276 (+) Transcript_61570:533-1360(+)